MESTLTKHMHAKMKINKSFVIERYRNKERLKNYILKAKKGLFEEEKLLIKKYVKPSDRVLVVGCGTGREIFGLKKLGIKDIVGIDISPDMIREAKKLLPDTELIISNIVEFKSKKNFDVVVFFNNIIEQIPSLSEKKKAILNAKRLLREGGKIILSTHSCFYERSIFRLIRNLIFYVAFKLKLSKKNPFEYINKKEKIYASYSNPFTIKKIIGEVFEIKEINSKKFILQKKQPKFFYIFDEPVYYVGELK